MTLVEMIVTLVLSGLLLTASPALLRYGVETFVWLPKAVAVDRVAAEAVQQLSEGGAALAAVLGSGSPYGEGPEVRGLRHASRTGAAAQAIWLAEAERVGVRTPEGQCVVFWRDAGREVILAGLVPSATCGAACNPAPPEQVTLPYDVEEGTVRIRTTGRLFEYYNQDGAVVPDGCPPGAIRRVEIRFTVQTGSGLSSEGETQTPVASAIAIRVP